MKRKRIFDIIEKNNGDDLLSRIYDLVIIFSIILSLIPLALKNQYQFFIISDKIVTCLFIIDYFLRLITSDYKMNKGALSFILYPFTFMALVDLFSILPSLNFLTTKFKLLKIFRLFRSFRIFRAAKLLRYSNGVILISEVLHEKRKELYSVCFFAVSYILISALVIFNIEPQSFKTFFDAIYWSTVSLTTVGYGDIYPVSCAGRLISMISSFFGIGIIALPAGIITAGFTEKIKNQE